MTTIVIAAAVILDDAGRVLLVRKSGTLAFMQPGGKIDLDERPEVCLARELREELGVEMQVGATFLGRFAAPAANEPDTVVDAYLFQAEIAGSPVAAAEIDAIAWVAPGDTDVPPLAPLTRDVVLPLAGRLR